VLEAACARPAVGKSPRVGPRGAAWGRVTVYRLPEPPVCTPVRAPLALQRDHDCPAAATVPVFVQVNALEVEVIVCVGLY
jgi:hypothetical protein